MAQRSVSEDELIKKEAQRIFEEQRQKYLLNTHKKPEEKKDEKKSAKKEEEKTLDDVLDDESDDEKFARLKKEAKIEQTIQEENKTTQLYKSSEDVSYETQKPGENNLYKSESTQAQQSYQPGGRLEMPHEKTQYERKKDAREEIKELLKPDYIGR